MPTRRRTWQSVAPLEWLTATAGNATWPTRISPWWDGSSPWIQRSSVLLPPPDGPMTAATSPRATVSDTPSSTRAEPWLLINLRTSIIDVLLRSSFRELRFHSPRHERQRVAHDKVQHRG